MAFTQKTEPLHDGLPEAYTPEDEYMMLNSWNKDGTPMVVKGNGHQTEYHENGKIKGEGEYVAGRKNGIWVFYHDNGKKESEGLFADGKPKGKWVYYYRKGKLRTEIEY